MKYLLNKQELKIFNDIISVNESRLSIIDKVKKYATKGLLTTSLILTLLASPKISAQDKEKIKEITKTETTTQTYAEKRAAGPLDIVIKVNGKEVAKGRVPVSAPLGFTANDCLDIGIDLGSPVSIDYFDNAPFKFNGSIDQMYVKYMKQ